MEPETAAKAAEVAVKANEAGWFRMAHVLGALVYFGSVMAAARLLGPLGRAEAGTRAATASMLRTVHLTLTFPAALLLLGSGIYMLVVDPAGVGYLKQPWMHIKLTVALLILAVDHLLIMKPLKGFAKGTADPAALGGLHKAGFWMLGLLAIALTTALFVVRKT
jgi:uncharacterized membrane protein